MKENEEKKTKHEKRVKRLIFSTGLFAILLVTSTYAWFIGMQSVNVTTFDVKIASIDGLALSLDGEKFGETVVINAANYKDVGYTGNQNSWGGEDGLIPISSAGIIDNATSKLIMFEKASLTTSQGGYRIMASRVSNTDDAETNGYVAFDLFVKNLSGKEYYTEYEPLNEEAIYLTTDSAVKVAAAGSVATSYDFEGQVGTGIENSVRVAFAQIARVKATEQSASVITGMDCNSTGNVTVICDKRSAQIWEPNDTKHVQNAINWYKKSCKKRVSTGDDVTKAESYSGECGEIKNGESYPTYAISGVIDQKYMNVDIYDGEKFNSYEKNTSTAPAEGKLFNYNYFTDTEKMQRGNDRPTFITLAPNSITKIRIYIWIEGQDIDNYDFAQLGKAISVNFGLSKERYTDKDVSYDDKNTATLPDDVIQKTPSDN